MATILKKTSAQYPLVSEITLNIGTDSAVNTSGVETNFKATAGVFDLIGHLPGATVIGGEMIVEAASDDTGTATLSVGDSASATRYLSAQSIKSTGRTALTLTGYKSTLGAFRFTLANQNGNAGAGRVTVRILYTVANRSNETTS